MTSELEKSDSSKKKLDRTDNVEITAEKFDGLESRLELFKSPERPETVDCHERRLVRVDSPQRSPHGRPKKENVNWVGKRKRWAKRNSDDPLYVPHKKLDKVPARRGRRPGRFHSDFPDVESELSCHNCARLLSKDRVLIMKHVTCSSCPMGFCGGCLLHRYGENIDEELAEGVKWVCPRCRQGCGEGCIITCCNCGPCRRMLNLRPTGRLSNSARSAGFNNMHDYLVHFQTGESAATIAARKKGRGWTSIDGWKQGNCPAEVQVPCWAGTRIRMPASSAKGLYHLNRESGHKWGGETIEWLLKEKNRETQSLRATVDDLVDYQQKIKVEFEKVKQYLCNQSAQRRPSITVGRPTLCLEVLDSTFKAAVAALDCFTTHFVAYSETRFHAPADQIWKQNFRNVYLAKESHWTYALKAFFYEKMFAGFENETFMTDSASLYLDPAKLREESYAHFKLANESLSPALLLREDAHFRTFCEQKFNSIVPDAVLLRPISDWDIGYDIENPVHKLTEINLSKSFMVAAMKVWTYHKLCFAFEPAANIFRARRGHVVDWDYLESVVRLEDDDMFIPNVGFMIVPGFRICGSIIKSQIYLAAKSGGSRIGIHDLQPVGVKTERVLPGSEAFENTRDFEFDKETV